MYSATLGLPNEKSSALNGNHLEISTYESKDDDNFSRVAGNIAMMIDKISSVTLAQESVEPVPVNPIPDDTATARGLKQAIAEGLLAPIILERLRVYIDELRQGNRANTAQNIQVYVLEFIQTRYPDDNTALIELELAIGDSFTEYNNHVAALKYFKKAYVRAVQVCGINTFNPALVAVKVSLSLLTISQNEEGLHYYDIARTFQNRLDSSPVNTATVFQPRQSIHFIRLCMNNSLYERKADTIKCLRASWELTAGQAREVILLFAEDFAGKAWLDNQTTLAVEIANFVIDMSRAERELCESEVCKRCKNIISRINSGEILLKSLPSEREQKYS
jgi:hypothetical protein